MIGALHRAGFTSCLVCVVQLLYTRRTLPWLITLGAFGPSPPPPTPSSFVLLLLEDGFVVVEKSPLPHQSYVS